MSCAFSHCGCGAVAGAVASGEPTLDPVLEGILNNLRERGANMNAHAIFTFSWNTKSDLDIWVRHKESGLFVYYNKKNNSELGLNLDVDANVIAETAITNPIENIGVITSDKSPDGHYEVYLDNFTNRDQGNNFFRVLTAFKKKGQNEFRNIALLKNTVSFDPPRYNGDFSKMLKVIEVNKVGRNYSISYLAPTLEPETLYGDYINLEV